MSKEKLSSFVEELFKRHSGKGLHICDLATGGGKSYTIGKLTCEHYPKKYDKIVILCVKNDLVNAMDKDVEKHIHSAKSCVGPEDKIVVRNNVNTMVEAIQNKAMDSLLTELDNIKFNDKKKSSQFKSILKKICSEVIDFEGILSLSNDFAEKIKSEKEESIRSGIKRLIKVVKESNKEMKNSEAYDFFTKRCPSLTKVFPQIDFDSKKIILMTIYKSYMGIDTLFFGRRNITRIHDFENTLFIFDESDQCAIALRSCIIANSIREIGFSDETKSIYNLYKFYYDQLSKEKLVADDKHKNLWKSTFKTAKDITDKMWNQRLQGTGKYISILPKNANDTNEYIKGIFFSGITMHMYIQPKRNKIKSFVCHKKGSKFFSLSSSDDLGRDSISYDMIISEKSFISNLVSSIKYMRNKFCEIIYACQDKRIKDFKKSLNEIATNKRVGTEKRNMPRIDNEVHTFVSRLGVVNGQFFENQLLDHMTNRKNIKLKNNKKTDDNSVYAQGFMYFENQMDPIDYEHGIHLAYKQISTTPEKILVDLLDENLGNSVILCSATANNNSVVSNFDFTYVSKLLNNKIDRLTKDEYMAFDTLIKNTYPKDHKIDIKPILDYQYDASNDKDLFEMPQYYTDMFDRNAIDSGNVNIWYNKAKSELINFHSKKKSPNIIESVMYDLKRLWRFVESYHYFHTNDDIHSMLFFQNRLGERDKIQYTVLACLIDGTYRNFGILNPYIKSLPTEWENKRLLFTKDREEIELKAQNILEKNNKAKLMLVAAYNSFKAGANLQYKVPDGANCVYGDDWSELDERKKKDWDAIYVDLPTNYLSQDNNDLSRKETSFYNILLTLCMFQYKGLMSSNEVAYWIYKAKNNQMFFSENVCNTILLDKVAWLQTTIEQAIGRIARTKNKPLRTHILFDDRIGYYAQWFNTKKSMAPEFREFVEYQKTHSLTSTELDKKMVQAIKENMRNNAYNNLNTIRHKAFRYIPKPNGDDYWIMDEEDEAPNFVIRAQKQNESFKKTILRKPFIDTIDELTDEEKFFPDIDWCYTDTEGENFESYTSKSKLEILMKNNVIKRYFVKHGYATEWKCKGMALHKDILESVYAGEIGEQAFKALVLEYTGWDEDKLPHLEGKLYEYADFILKNIRGDNRIAFDVKNLCPTGLLIDNPWDMPSMEKLAVKQERLSCNVILVNIIEIAGSTMDEVKEIPGLIDRDGKVIKKNMDKLMIYLKGKI